MWMLADNTFLLRVFIAALKQGFTWEKSNNNNNNNELQRSFNRVQYLFRGIAHLPPGIHLV